MAAGGEVFLTRMGAATVRAYDECTMTGLWTLPNLLSLLRLLSAPVLVALASLEHREAFLWLLAAAFVSDALDGVLARGTGQTSQLGARIDSWADVAVYAALAISLVLLWPGLVRSEWLAFSAIVVSVAVPAVVGFARFGRFTSYHTFLTKVAVLVTAVGVFAMVLGISNWPFRFGALVALLSACEEIAISVVLHRERSDVGGLLRVLREQRRERH